MRRGLARIRLDISCLRIGIIAREDAGDLGTLVGVHLATAVVVSLQSASVCADRRHAAYGDGGAGRLERLDRGLSPDS